MTGDELRAARLSRGFTLRQLAEALGVSTNSVVRWERREMAMQSPHMVATVLAQLPHTP